MKVYIVVDEIAYEGSEIADVFQSKDAAHAFCRSKTGLLLPNQTGVYSIDRGYHWLAIESWEVKE